MLRNELGVTSVRPVACNALLCPIMMLKDVNILGLYSFERLKIYYSCGTQCYVLFVGIGSSCSDSEGRNGERICSSSRHSPSSNTANFYAAHIPSLFRTNYQLSC